MKKGKAKRQKRKKSPLERIPTRKLLASIREDMQVMAAEAASKPPKD